MSKKGKLKKFNQAQQKENEEIISELFGEEKVKESNENFNRLSSKEQNQVLNECQLIFEQLAKYIHEDKSEQEINDLLVEWHIWIKKFFNPSLEVLRGLGLMYAAVPEFREFFEAIDPELPDFLPKVINTYVEELEDKWLEEQYNVLEE